MTCVRTLARLVMLIGLLAACGSPATLASPAPTISSTAAPPILLVPKTSDAIASSVWCGTVVVNTITTGQGSAPDSYQLASPTGVLNGRFVWPGGQSALGTYVCARLIGGAPMSGFNGLVGPGDPGYVAQATAAIDSCGPVTA